MIDSPGTEEKVVAEVVHLDTRTLLVRHVKGDPDAFAELIGKFRRRVYSYLVRCGIPAEARDDLFQEIFIKVHHAAPTYQAERPLEPWLFTVVANTVRSYFRKQAVKRRLSGTIDSAPKTQEIASGDEVAEAQELAQWLELQIAALPENQREVISLYCFQTLSQKDVATILGSPLGTVKTNLHRARAALAKALVARQKQASEEVS